MKWYNAKITYAEYLNEDKETLAMYSYKATKDIKTLKRSLLETQLELISLRKENKIEKQNRENKKNDR